MWVVTLVFNSAVITSFKAALNMEASVGIPFRIEKWILSSFRIESSTFLEFELNYVIFISTMSSFQNQNACSFPSAQPSSDMTWRGGRRILWRR